MRRLLKIVLVLAALSGLATLMVFLAARRALPRFLPPSDRLPRGVFHCHAEDSHDSRTTLERVIEVARERKLDFVVLTDHNSQLEEPMEMDGVIVISYAELSTDFGHVVQLGARGVPSSEERERTTVLSEIRERGGIPVLSHPFDPRIPWRGSFADAGGIEIVNASTTARHAAGKAFVGLLSTLIVYRFNHELALAQLYDRDDEALEIWDARPDPRFAGYCAVDAHGRIDLQDNMSIWETVLEDPLPEDTSSRPEAILEALEAGRFQCASGLFGRPSLSLQALSADGRTHEPGSSLPAGDVTEIIARGPVPVPGDPQPTIVLLRDGREVSRETGESLRLSRPDPGTYRAEVRISVPAPFLGRHDATVLYSNRIRLVAP